jgi:hypothetical protein
MNTPARHPIRLACRLIRFWSAWLENTPTRHLASCEDCRNHFAAQAAFEQQLRRQARRTAHDVPDGLEERVFAAVAPTLRRQRRHTQPALWVGLAAAGAAAAVILTLLMLPQPGPSDQLVREEPAVFAMPSLAALERYPERLRETIAPVVSTLPSENPLEQEIASVRADTRSALRFLAMNFLPASTAATILPENNGNGSSS